MNNKQQSQRGYLVITKDGKHGRTYHCKGRINGKIPVYLETSPGVYSDKGTLCDEKTLTLNGFID